MSNNLQVALPSVDGEGSTIKHLGPVFKRIREEKNITQEQLEVMCNSVAGYYGLPAFSRGRLSDWERKNGDITLYRLMVVATALGISSNDIGFDLNLKELGKNSRNSTIYLPEGFPEQLKHTLQWIVKLIAKGYKVDKEELLKLKSAMDSVLEQQLEEMNIEINP